VKNVLNFARSINPQVQDGPVGSYLKNTQINQNIEEYGALLGGSLSSRLSTGKRFPVAFISDTFTYSPEAPLSK
jgi:hypothetical protein